MYETTKQVLVFKTNIRTKADRLVVKDSLDSQQLINQWSVDMQDVDCVLRIETPGISPHEIITLINRHGYQCSELE